MFFFVILFIFFTFGDRSILSYVLSAVSDFVSNKDVHIGSDQCDQLR